MQSYQILSRRGGKEYLLQKDGVTLGSLSLEHLHGTRATINIGETSVSVRRKHAFKKHVFMIHGIHGELSFDADAFSRGMLAFHGRAYHWAPRNVRWSEWAWQAEGQPAIALRFEENMRRPKGTASSEVPLTDEDDIFLALFGWYLLLINHHSFGMHVLSAVSLAFSK